MAKAVNNKICGKCGRVLPLNSFYLNKGWKQQNYHDYFCRQCYARYCRNESSVEDYFMENNRRWSHDIWQTAVKKAEYNLSNSEAYLKATGDKRLSMLDEAAARVLPSLMNLNKFYMYVENQHMKDIAEIEQQKADEERKAAKIVYSQEWRGSFTEAQIAAMDSMYEEYEKDFDLSTVSRRDYVRKLIKASMNADIAEDKLRRGEISVTEYRDLNKIYDDLAKSSAIAEASRKAGGSTALNSLGNIILGLQINHHLDINPYHFQDDDVDKVYNDYAHLTAAVGAQL